MATFFTKTLLAKFEFPARISNKTRLNLQVLWKIVQSDVVPAKRIIFLDHVEPA